ncbi:MAG: bifunctional riboflavin kinase/FAD synthetase [Alphaproteobacteria bacterium]|nr:bifunctional riboflavin kinase/FAD synthetase [Alphaproteobacteria bacterium]
MVDGASVIAAIGNFDGVHLGHQYLLGEAARFAVAQDARLGVVLFEPHPRRYFRPDDAAFLLTSSAQRDALLRVYGATEIFTLTFDKALASLTPEEFIRLVLKQKLGLGGIVAGADFRFGAGRAGDSQALLTIGDEAGLKVKIVDLLPQPADGAKFGSSAVRAAVRDGDMARARVLLGRPWAVRGVVAQGEQRGRTLGFPTANMTLGEIIEPRRGVYATRARVGGVAHDAVSNFGRRPTVGSEAPLLETHILDFDGDLYGREIEVDFIDFIRDEVKFDGLDALKAQIAKDSVKARALLA